MADVIDADVVFVGADVLAEAVVQGDEFFVG